MEKFATSVDKIRKVFSHGGMIALFGMMILGTADVAGRYLLNRPITGTLEVFEILMPVLVLLGLADTQSVDEHLTAGVIEFFRFKPETRTKIRFGVQALVFCLFLLITWRGVGGQCLRCGLIGASVTSKCRYGSLNLLCLLEPC
jgi:TRAP-type C4-dicarboxylate transport system permease small subunit